MRNFDHACKFSTLTINFSEVWPRQILFNLMIRLENVLISRYLCKTSWRCLENVFAKRLEDVLKMYGQDEYIGLDQDVFWRRKAKANIFVLIKTSWRRLQDIFWRRRRKTSKTTSSRRMFAGKCLPGYSQKHQKLSNV